MIIKKFAVFAFSATKEAVTDGLNSASFVETESGDPISYGFVPVLEESNAHAAGNLIAFKLRVDSRRVPPSAVSKEVQRRAQAIEEESGFKPGRKHIKEIKEQVITDLLLKAIPSQSFVDGWFDFDTSRLVIAETTDSKIDLVVSFVLKSVDQSSIQPLRTVWAPSVIMTAWLESGEVPDSLTIDDRAKFEFPHGGKASLTAVNVTDERVTQLLSMRAVVSELAVTISDKWSVTVSSGLRFKGLRHLGIESEAYEDRESAFNGELLVNADAATKVFDFVANLFGGIGSTDSGGTESATDVTLEESLDSKLAA